MSKHLESIEFPEIGKYDTDHLARINGYYEDMTVGRSENFVTNLSETESEPFTFRTSGGSLEIGDREELTVGGGSLPWNQLANYIESSGAGVTRTVDANNVLNFSGTATGNVSLIGRIDHISGHRYMFLFDVIANPNDVSFTVGMGQGDPWLTNVTSSRYRIYTSSFSSYLSLYDVTNKDLTGLKLRIMIYDLTQMFGSTIADYIRSLEQGTAGAGVAWFKKLFPKDYYPYNVGEMLHVQTSEFKTVGFNAWDEELESGGISTSTGATNTDDAYLRTKNFTPILPNTQYYYKAPSAIIYGRLFYYDANKNFLQYSGSSSNLNHVVTTPTNAYYMKFVLVKEYYGTTYNHDICFNIHWDGTRDGEYEPYNEHSYPLDDSLTLRGMLRLDSDNNLYFDGDTYENDGTVARKWKQIVIDGVNVVVYSFGAKDNGYCVYCPLIDYDRGVGALKSAVSDRFVPSNEPIQTMPLWTFVGASGANTTMSFMLPSTITSAEEANAWFAQNPTTVVYKLAENKITTESAEPYQTPQIVDNWGTEEFVVPTQSGVEIPVGHDTVYPISLRDKLESAPNLPDGDGDYIMRMSSGEASYAKLASQFPAPPTENGNYVLKATVTNGTATLSWEVQS